MQGCKSEHAYADECDLGHSYAPEDLIAPKSSLTGTVPEMRPVENWYFDLPAFGDFLRVGAPLTLAIALATVWMARWLWLGGPLLPGVGG